MKKIIIKLKSTWKLLRKNKGAVAGLVVIGLFLIVALFAPFLAPHSPKEIFSDAINVGPLWTKEGLSRFPFGTDDIGRDLLSRLIYGARISLSVGFLVVVFSLSVGSFLGMVAGYFGGLIDRTIMRITDILMALPSILLAIVVVSILGPGLFNAVLAVSVIALPNFIRVVRASVIAENAKEYALAAKGLGAGHIRVLFKNILPNCMAPIIVQGALSFSDGILNVAALGFLGLGAQAPMAEWGTMLADSRAFIESSPWLVTLPGLCILIVVLAFNLFGDGVRDALDPKLKQS